MTCALVMADFSAALAPPQPKVQSPRQPVACDSVRPTRAAGPVLEHRNRLEKVLTMSPKPDRSFVTPMTTTPGDTAVSSSRRPERWRRANVNNTSSAETAVTDPVGHDGATVSDSTVRQPADNAHVAASQPTARLTDHGIKTLRHNTDPHFVRHSAPTHGEVNAAATAPVRRALATLRRCCSAQTVAVEFPAEEGR